MKNRVKFVLTSALILVMSLILTVSAGAIANTGIDTTELSRSFYHVNPVYQDVLETDDLAAMLAVQDNDGITGAPLENSVSRESLEEAGITLRKAMVLRQTSVEISLLVDADIWTQEDMEQWAVGEGQYWLSQAFYDIVDIALLHTGVPNEGDYLMYQYLGLEASISIGTVNGDADIHYLYNIAYYTTAEQEEAVTEKVNDLCEQLGLRSSAGNYDKIKSIYDWICGNVVYDYPHLNNKEYKIQFTAYGALIDGTSVCQGYANLFYRLALEAGVDARIISGVAYTDPNDPSVSEGHAWNIVRLGSLYYYHLDSTWDAGEEEYSWFLKGGDTLADHERSDGSREGDFLDYTSDEFYAAYPMAKEDYTPGAVQIGDIDGDGIPATPKDAMVLARYIAEWDGYTNQINLDAADLDGDGIPATPRDAMVLARHIAGWTGYEIIPLK